VCGQHQVGVDRRRVLARHPHPDRGLGIDLGQVDDLDQRRWILAHPSIGLDAVAQLLQHRDDVGGERDLEDDVHPSATVGAVVQDHVGEDLAVGDHHLDVVGCRQLGDQQVERLYRALAPGALDDVPDPVGPEDQDHHPGGDVGQRPLQRQADGQGRGGQDGDDRGRLHPQLLQHRDKAHGQDAEPHHRADEGLQGGVGRMALGMQSADGALHETRGPAGNPDGQHQDDGGGHEVHRQLAGDVGEPGDDRLPGGEMLRQLRIDRLGKSVHSDWHGWLAPRSSTETPHSGFQTSNGATTGYRVCVEMPVADR